MLSLAGVCSLWLEHCHWLGVVLSVVVMVAGVCQCCNFIQTCLDISVEWLRLQNCREFSLKVFSVNYVGMEATPFSERSAKDNTCLVNNVL